MRINVYSQELTPEVIQVEKPSNTGVTYHAAQLILHSNALTRWMLPIATLEEMIALIRKQEAALKAATTQGIRAVASSPEIPDSSVTVDTPELPTPAAFMKRSEWDDALKKLQSFNGWRIKYSDCDMALYTAGQVNAHTSAAVARAVEVASRDKDGNHVDELRVERFDQDRGEWIEGGEPFGWYYSEQQPDYSKPTQPPAGELPVLPPLHVAAQSVVERFNDPCASLASIARYVNELADVLATRQPAPAANNLTKIYGEAAAAETVRSFGEKRHQQGRAAGIEEAAKHCEGNAETIRAIAIRAIIKTGAV